jgi:hypothetical protein
VRRLARDAAVPAGLALVLSLALGLVVAAAAPASSRLAVLIAGPWEGEIAMQNDVVAMIDALRRRGFARDELVVLEGRLTRAALLAFLQDVHQRIAAWARGEILLHVSGHGTLEGKTAATARAGLVFTSVFHPGPDDIVWWDEVFAALQAPSDVRVILLPDS